MKSIFKKHIMNNINKCFNIIINIPENEIDYVITLHVAYVKPKLFS